MILRILNHLLDTEVPMSQPLGYPHMNDEQKARGAALRIASETLCLEPKDENTISIISAAVFILDGAESYQSFLNALAGTGEAVAIGGFDPFQTFGGETIDLSGN